MFLLNVSWLVLGHYDISSLIFLNTLQCLTFSVEKAVSCTKMFNGAIYSLPNFLSVEKKWIVVSKTDIS